MAHSNRLPWAIVLFGFALFVYVWGLGRVPFYQGEPREAVQVWEQLHRCGTGSFPCATGRSPIEASSVPLACTAPFRFFSVGSANFP
jgi:hypothetical protein